MAIRMRAGNRLQARVSPHSLVLPGFMLLYLEIDDADRVILHRQLPWHRRWLMPGLHLLILHQGNLQQAEAYRRLRVLLRHHYFETPSANLQIEHT